MNLDGLLKRNLFMSLPVKIGSNPLIVLPLINALGGVQYVFLIILATLFFFKFPEILKEEISRKVLLQKTLAIWLIVAGLALLSLG